jgi:hypothetical protein
MGHFECLFRRFRDANHTGLFSGMVFSVKNFVLEDDRSGMLPSACPDLENVSSDSHQRRRCGSEGLPKRLNPNKAKIL